MIEERFIYIILPRLLNFFTPYWSRLATTLPLSTEVPPHSPEFVYKIAFIFKTTANYELRVFIFMYHTWRYGKTGRYKTELWMEKEPSEFLSSENFFQSFFLIFFDFFLFAPKSGDAAASSAPPGRRRQPRVPDDHSSFFSWLELFVDKMPQHQLQMNYTLFWRWGFRCSQPSCGVGSLWSSFSPGGWGEWTKDGAQVIMRS